MGGWPRGGLTSPGQPLRTWALARFGWEENEAALGLPTRLPPTLSPQVAGLYKKQSQIQNQQGAEPDSEQEEFY